MEGVCQSIRLAEEERRLADTYAKHQKISIAEAFKKALFDKIEDKYDLMVVESTYKNYVKEPKTYSLDEAWEKILNISALNVGHRRTIYT